MHKGNFGELLTGGKKPEYNEAVFATIQTLSGAALENYAPDYFDVIIMDECHHINAASWDKVFNYFGAPRIHWPDRDPRSEKTE